MHFEYTLVDFQPISVSAIFIYFTNFDHLEKKYTTINPFTSRWVKIVTSMYVDFSQTFISAEWCWWGARTRARAWIHTSWKSSENQVVSIVYFEINLLSDKYLKQFKYITCIRSHRVSCTYSSDVLKNLQ